MEKQCTYCSSCPLYRGSIGISEDIRIMYTYYYCLNESDRWKQCKRYTVKTTAGQCPDFVMPNTLLTEEQIRQKSLQEYAMEN